MLLVLYGYEFDGEVEENDDDCNLVSDGSEVEVGEDVKLDSMLGTFLRPGRCGDGAASASGSWVEVESGFEFELEPSWYAVVVVVVEGDWDRMLDGRLIDSTSSVKVSGRPVKIDLPPSLVDVNVGEVGPILGDDDSDIWYGRPV